MLDKSRPVFVSGASGFIATHLVEDLLSRGYRVRGSVRKVGKPSDHPALTSLAGAKERLELVEADLLAEGAFDDHVAGCSAVIHTASPYVMHVKDPQRDLVDPALLGTRSILGACAKAKVGRVVLTSSMAAVTDEPDSDHVLTEEDWNDKSNLERNPYYYSKALAEREAWEVASATGLDLVVINPFLVIGPASTKSLNPSNQVFSDILSGTYPGIMSVAWGFVDVRDVAHAHVLAMETASAKGRYICANETVSMRDLVEMLRKDYGRYKLPSMGLDCAAGDFAVKLGSYFQPKGIGSYLRTHLGRTPRFDNGKIQRELGLAFRPLPSTIKDTVEDLLRWGHVKALA